MANTNPKDFKTFLSLIPKEVLDKVWFFPIRSNRKVPDVPQGTILKANSAYRLTPAQSYQRLKNGLNVGIYALPQGLMFVDLDVSKGKIIASQDILDALDSMNTLKVQTRNGGYQYYFVNSQNYPTQLLKENKIIIGELRNNWSYVVSIGSYVDIDENNAQGDGTYRILQLNSIKSFAGLTIAKTCTITNTDQKTSEWMHEKSENKISNEEMIRMRGNKIRVKI